MRAHTSVGVALLVAMGAAAACSSASGRAATDPAQSRGSTPLVNSAITATRASSETAAAHTVRPPAGWKTVWYHGIGADIPASWRIASGNSFVCSFGATAIAYVGPTHVFYPCAMPAPGRPGNNGLWIDASYGAPGGSMFETSLHGIAVDIGVAADPTIAHQIEASLRNDPAVPDSPT